MVSVDSLFKVTDYLIMFTSRAQLNAMLGQKDRIDAERSFWFVAGASIISFLGKICANPNSIRCINVHG